MSNYKDFEAETYGLLQLKISHTNPFRHLTLDYLDPLPKYNKKSCILVTMNNTTRFDIVKAMEKANGQTTVKSLLEDILSKYVSRNTDRSL